MKFAMSLYRWPWANGGKYIDIDVIIKVPPGRAVRMKAGKGRGHPLKFDLGADAAAYFSAKVCIHRRN